MWRTDGDIEIYGYIENEEERDFCDDDPNVVWALVYFYLGRSLTFFKGFEFCETIWVKSILTLDDMQILTFHFNLIRVQRTC